jgi:hypothetical protein
VTRTALAPFAVRSFRFQWPADLATSWAFEMELLILGWYVLVATGSVQHLVAFGALAWMGTLFSPFFLGPLGDRIGIRALICATRGLYAVLALIMTGLTLSGALAPWHVFTVAAIAGLVKPSDMGMRYVLVGQTIRPEMLMGALGISRTTSDTARIAGALAGTGGVALLGMGAAYAAVSLLYVAAFVFSLNVAGQPGKGSAARLTATVADLSQAVRYMWGKPELLGAFSIAFLVNLVGFPFFMGLLPYAARDVYDIGQSGLGWLAAAFASGALAGSLLVGSGRLRLRGGRIMLWTAGVWFGALLLLGQTKMLALGLSLIFLAGFAQSLCLTPLAAVMLRASSDEMRGRVMGLRMLAIWGLPLGLLAAGPLIEHLGYSASTLIYATVGLAAVLAIGVRWRHALWRASAPANATI